MKPLACTAALLVTAWVAAGCSDRSSGSDLPPTRSLPIPVVGGEVASIAEYPSTVALTDGSGEPFCTGTLVSPTLVVTAAHCLQDWWGNAISPNEVRIVYGFEIPSNAPNSDRRKAASVHPHPQYDPYASTDSDGMGHTNDIGAVVLQQPIENAVIAPVLPPGEVDTELTAGREVHVVGFGIYNLNSGVGGKLYKGVTPHVRHIEWEMLAGQPGEPDTCNGDSGGPAYLVVNGSLFLTGITSRAWAKSVHSCGDGGLYTIASQYVTWLESVGGELDGGVTDGGGFDGGPQEDAKPMLDANPSCLSPLNVCNPVTNEGCDTSQGEACRLDSNGSTSCHAGENDELPGAVCDQTSRFCLPGYHCAPSIRCEQYCCSDADCTGGGDCTSLMASVGTLGTCGVPPKPDAAEEDAPAGEDAQAHEASVDDGSVQPEAAADASEPDAGQAPEPAPREVIEGAGCGCEVTGAANRAVGLWLLAGMLGLVGLRRFRGR